MEGSEAQESIGRRSLETAGDATDSTTEQGLEVARITRLAGLMSDERREGKGRGDAIRLLARGKL